MRFLTYDSKTLPDERWSALCAADPAATIFHLTEWSRLWERSRNDARAEWWVLVGDDGQWIGGLPVVRFSRWGINRLYSQPVGSYGGWVGPLAGEYNELISRWLSRQIRLRVAEAVFMPWSGNDPVRYPGQKAPRERFVIDLSLINEDQSWKINLRRNIVRNLRSATDHGWKIEMVKNPDDVERTRPLWEQTFARHGRKLDAAVWRFYRLLPQVFRAGETLFWWVATDDRGPAATTIGFRYRHGYYAYNGAMDLSRKDDHPMHILYETAIDEAVRLGCKFFDFGSGLSPGDGLAHFKRGWGAQAEIYYEYHFKRRWWPR